MRILLYATMRIFNHSSVFRLCLLFSITIFLIPLNHHRTALVSAKNWDLGADDDPNDPNRGKSDYPNDEAIDMAFAPPGRDNTVIFADIANIPSMGQQPFDYWEWSEKSSIFDVYSEPFQFQIHSERWLGDWIVR